VSCEILKKKKPKLIKYSVLFKEFKAGLLKGRRQKDSTLNYSNLGLVSSYLDPIMSKDDRKGLRL
jgi:hypothetical protein